MDLPFGRDSQEMPTLRRQSGVIEVSQALVLSTLAVTSLPFLGSVQDRPTLQPRAQQPVHSRPAFGATAPASTPFAQEDWQNPTIAPQARQADCYSSSRLLSVYPPGEAVQDTPRGAQRVTPDVTRNLLTTTLRVQAGAVDYVLTLPKDYQNPVVTIRAQQPTLFRPALDVTGYSAPSGLLTQAKDWTNPVLAKRLPGGDVEYFVPAQPVPYLLSAKDWQNPVLAKFNPLVYSDEAAPWRLVAPTNTAVLLTAKDYPNPWGRPTQQPNHHRPPFNPVNPAGGGTADPYLLTAKAWDNPRQPTRQGALDDPPNLLAKAPPPPVIQFLTGAKDWPNPVRIPYQVKVDNPPNLLGNTLAMVQAFESDWGNPPYRLTLPIWFDAPNLLLTPSVGQVKAYDWPNPTLRVVAQQNDQFPNIAALRNVIPVPPERRNFDWPNPRLIVAAQQPTDRHPNLVTRDAPEPVQNIDHLHGYQTSYYIDGVAAYPTYTISGEAPSYYVQGTGAGYYLDGYAEYTR